MKLLRLEDFIDNARHGMPLELEPQGTLFAEVNCVSVEAAPVWLRICFAFQFHFENPTFSPKPRLQRQDKLFVKHKGKVLRPFELGTNIAAWSRLLKKDFPQIGPDERSLIEENKEIDIPPPPPDKAAEVLAAELDTRLTREKTPENGAHITSYKERRMSSEKKKTRVSAEPNGQSEDLSRVLASVNIAGDDRISKNGSSRKSPPKIPDRKDFGSVWLPDAQVKFSSR